MEPTFRGSPLVLDVLSEHIALLDAGSRVAAVNQAWLEFARRNGGAEDGYQGTSYLEVCRAAAERGSPEAGAVGEGVRAVLDGDVERFTLEYPCHAPNVERWFILDATRLPGDPGGAVVAHVDISQRKRAENALAELNRVLEARVRERTRQVRELAAQLTLAEAKERARLARLLHDDLQQQLYAVRYSLEDVARAAGDAVATVDALGASRRLLVEAIAVSRTVTTNLSPPVLRGEGLVEALQWLASDMRSRYRLDVAIEADEFSTVPRESWRVLLFELIRELLFNVAKHAGTDTATVRLAERGDRIELSVHDPGRGFDPARLDAGGAGTGLGLATVRRRLQLFGGRLEVDSAQGCGTRATLSLPRAALAS